MPHRPVLSPALPRAWRGEALQLGRAPGVLLEDAGRHRDLLALLDGTRTLDQVVEQATDPDAAAVLAVLDEHGLLLDADDLHPAGLDRAERDRLAPDLAALSLVHGSGVRTALQRRRAARVVVHGAGRVGGPLASLLAGAGIGTVDVRDDCPATPADTAVGGLSALDTGRSRGEAVASRLRSQGSPRPPDLVVLADAPGHGGTEASPHGDTAASLVRTGTPHLVARVDEAVGTVGPLVLPGRSACLQCLELTRTVLDPGWAGVSLQLGRRRSGAAACDSVLASAVASQAVLQVLELVEGGRPGSVGGTLELTLPGWAWRRRSWPQHPGCPCAWPVEDALRVA